MAFLLGMLTTGVALYILALNLTPVATWMLERSFPGAKVEIRRMDFKRFGQLDVDSVVLKSRKDGETLLSLAGGSVSFNFGDLRNLQVGEVRLVQPVIHASPRLMEAFAPPGTPAKKAGRPWSVRRLVCDYGELNVIDYGVSELALRAKFAFDFQNFSPTNAPERVHELMIWDASADLGGQAAFLTLAKATMEFSFAELNNGDIHSIRLEQPVLHASPGLMNRLTAKPGTPSEKMGWAWNVKQLVCDYGEINIADYGSRGLWLRAKYAFDFKDFSPAKAPTATHKGVIWNFTAAMEGKQPFFTVDTIKLGFSIETLLEQRELTDLALQGGSLVVGDDLRNLVDTTTKETEAKAPAEPEQKPWTIKALDIRKVGVRIDDDRPEVTDLVFEINTTMQNLALSQAASSLASEGQLIEIANFEAVSPRDPLTKVLSVDSIFVRFTLEGLLRKEIKEFLIVGPTIYLGEDLFIYMEDMDKQLGLSKPAAQGTEAPTPAKSGWVIQTLVVRYGKLSIGSGGKTQYGLPLEFRAYAQDVALDNLAALKLVTRLEIPAQKYVFESYQLEFTSEEGQLRFSYPPEKQEKNLVGEIRLKNVRWRQYEATDSYLTVTFDKQGINGNFGGKAYNGQADGGFSFFFDSTSPWIGWCAGERIDLKKLTNVISPQNFQMTGPLKFKLQMDAQGKNIDRILGEFQMTKPGKMKIGKLDDLLGRIPETWNPLKQSSTKIALETLRDFEYTKGGGDFWFVQSQGILQLQLQGPLGSRNFDIVLHTNDSPEGRWKHDSTKR